MRTRRWRLRRAESSDSKSPPDADAPHALTLTPGEGAGNNKPVPIVERITKEQLKERLDRGDKPTILDVRLKYAYEHSTVKLPGAIRVSPYAAESANLPPGAEIVAYDSDPNELVSTHVATVLRRKGHKVTVLKGGVPEWLAANFPIETKEAPRAIPPEPGSLKG